MSESPASLHTSICCKNLLCRFQPYLVSTFGVIVIDSKTRICTVTTWKKYISLINQKLQVQKAMELVLVPLCLPWIGGIHQSTNCTSCFQARSYIQALKKLQSHNIFNTCKQQVCNKTYSHYHVSIPVFYLCILKLLNVHKTILQSMFTHVFQWHLKTDVVIPTEWVANIGKKECQLQI